MSGLFDWIEWLDFILQFSICIIFMYIKVKGGEVKITQIEKYGVNE